MKRVILCAALAASATMGAMTAARAEDGQMRVKVGDLNLATSDGAQTALTRIQASAGAFCDTGAGRQPLERAAAQDRCVATMTRKGVDGLNAPLVTALANGRSQPAQPQQSVTLAAAK
jgi:UrcA family protein